MQREVRVDFYGGQSLKCSFLERNPGNDGPSVLLSTYAAKEGRWDPLYIGDVLWLIIHLVLNTPGFKR